MEENMSLEQLLSQYTGPGTLYESMPDGAVRCHACGHWCVIATGHCGACRMRFNRDGVLMVPHGYVNAIHADPIEKKPFFHAYPGQSALSFGMLGCNFHCPFCQNWISSQALRDARAGAPIIKCSARQIVNMALESGARAVCSTYNEPLITSEWALEVFRLAKEKGLATAYVSNGHANPAVLDCLRPWLDLFKVDLKCFDERHYQELGGKLSCVLETIQGIYERKFWLEVVTLVVPGFNDSDQELTAIAKYLAGVSPDIPGT